MAHPPMRFEPLAPPVAVEPPPIAAEWAGVTPPPPSPHSVLERSLTIDNDEAPLVEADAIQPGGWSDWCAGLGSAVAHLVILLFLALIPALGLERQDEEIFVELGDPTVVFEDTLEADLADLSLELSEPSDLPDIPEEPSLDAAVMADALAEQPIVSLAELAPLPPVMDLEAVTADAGELFDLGLGPIVSAASLAGRDGPNRAALLRRFGGTTETENAVELGLQWLKRQQGQDGLWRMNGPYPDGLAVENASAATGMALIAFQGAGSTHRQGKHQASVARGLAALLARQDSTGDFFANGGPVHHHIYTHAIATIAVCELYAMTQDRDLTLAAQRAIDWLVQYQTPEGGWRYSPGVDNDLSVTGWCVMALQSARMAGLDVPDRTFHRVTDYLNTLRRQDGALYGYQVGHGATPSMTAEGMLCRQYLGMPRSHPSMKQAAAYLSARTITRIPDPYYAYYASQVLHHYGGEPWDVWNRVMRSNLPRTQIRRGPQAGSWNVASQDSRGGRLYGTCLRIYCLEVYYRHLPLYDAAIREGDGAD